MESAVSSSAAMSFLKWLAVSFTHQNGRSIQPAAMTGTRKKFESITATDAPTAKNSRDKAQSMGKRADRPVTLRIDCTSASSRRR